MTNLDQQVAEAQGWEWKGDYSNDGDGIPSAWHRDGKIVHYDYYPTTDLNQAVAFAEWALQGNHYLNWLNIYIDGGILKTVGFYDQRLPRGDIQDGTFCEENVEASSDNLAEAICLATLKAMGKEINHD